MGGRESAIGRPPEREKRVAMTIKAFMDAMRAGAILSRDDCGASTWLSLEWPNGHSDAFDVPAGYRFRRFYTREYDRDDLAGIERIDGSDPVLVATLEPCRWDCFTNQTAYRLRCDHAEDSGKVGGDDKETESRARLLAAAPDLYDACRAFLDRYDQLREQWGDEGFTRSLADRVRAAVNLADAGR